MRIVTGEDWNKIMVRSQSHWFFLDFRNPAIQS
jgi:hypothetical protein